MNDLRRGAREDNKAIRIHDLLRDPVSRLRTGLSLLFRVPSPMQVLPAVAATLHRLPYQRVSFSRRSEVLGRNAPTYYERQ